MVSAKVHSVFSTFSLEMTCVKMVGRTGASNSNSVPCHFARHVTADWPIISSQWFVQNDSKCIKMQASNLWFPLAPVGYHCFLSHCCLFLHTGSFRKRHHQHAARLAFRWCLRISVDALCRLAHIGASLNNPKVAATMSKGQSAVGSSAEDLHRRAWTPGCTRPVKMLACWWTAQGEISSWRMGSMQMSFVHFEWEKWVSNLWWFMPFETFELITSRQEWSIGSTSCCQNLCCTGSPLPFDLLPQWHARAHRWSPMIHVGTHWYILVHRTAAD